MPMPIPPSEELNDGSHHDYLGLTLRIAAGAVGVAAVGGDRQHPAHGGRRCGGGRAVFAVRGAAGPRPLRAAPPPDRGHRELRGGADLLSGAAPSSISARRGISSTSARRRTRSTFPIIASLNGDFARRLDRAMRRQMQEAGADALELNIYYIPTDMEQTAEQVEQTYLDILAAVKSVVTIPVALKLGPFFSNMARMAQRLDDGRRQRAGAVQPLLPAGHRSRSAGGAAARVAEHAAGDAAAADLDRDPLRPHPRRHGGNQRCARGARTSSSC